MHLSHPETKPPHKSHTWKGVVYKDYNSSFDEILEQDNSYKIHHRNLQKLVTEIFKVKTNLGSEIMK